MTNKCDCLNYCGDDPRLTSNKIKLCKHLMLNRLREKKIGTKRERLIVAMLGKEIIRINHRMNLYRDKSDWISKAIFESTCIELSKVKMLFTEAKIMLKPTGTNK